MIDRCHAFGWGQFEHYLVFMRVANFICMKLLWYLLSHSAKAPCAVLDSHNDMKTCTYYFFFPISYERDYVLYVFWGATLTLLCTIIRYHYFASHNACETLQPHRWTTSTHLQCLWLFEEPGWIFLTSNSSIIIERFLVRCVACAIQS